MRPCWNFQQEIVDNRQNREAVFATDHLLGLMKARYYLRREMGHRGFANNERACRPAEAWPQCVRVAAWRTWKSIKSVHGQGEELYETSLPSDADNYSPGHSFGTLYLRRTFLYFLYYH